jgi:hypothetical protein
MLIFKSPDQQAQVCAGSNPKAVKKWRTREDSNLKPSDP